jgi:hypothetical protein
MAEDNSETIDSPPIDKADLLDRIQRAWSALMQTIEGLSPEQMDAPLAGGWSVKDHLAHLAAWEQFMLHYHLGGQPPHQAMGFDPATFKGLDEDGINALIYERSQDHTVEEILDNFKRSHSEVLATLEQMKFADLLLPRFAEDPSRDPVIYWVIGNTCDHYQEHRRTIIDEL